MLLERRVIKILNETRQELTRYPTREHLVVYLEKKRWPRWNYCFFSRERFHNFIDDVLGDCIEGRNAYIAYLEDRTSLAVTDKGREFIKLDCFLEECFKKHSHSTTLLLGSGGGIFITWLVIYFWRFMRSMIGL